MTNADSTGLIFNWGPPRPRARALVIFLGVSILFHAFCFYIFQIVYPPAVVLAPPPARVSLITNQTEDGRSLLRWIDAEDPALVTATLRPPGSRVHELPRLQHIPSYVIEQPQLKPLPPVAVDLRPPSPQPPGPVAIRHNAAPAPPLKKPTAVTFSEEIQTLGPATLPKMNFVGSIEDQPENARFRIAVDAQGEVQYAFPMNSSGDPALDGAARQLVALIRFASQPRQPGESLTWGVATVEWGSDVTRSTPSPSPINSPAS